MKKKLSIFKISCNYYIQAEDEREAMQYVADEGSDFFERHVLIELSSCEEDDIFNKETKGNKR